MQDKKVFLSQPQEVNRKKKKVWQKDFDHLKLLMLEGRRQPLSRTSFSLAVWAETWAAAQGATIQQGDLEKPSAGWEPWTSSNVSDSLLNNTQYNKETHSCARRHLFT